MLATFNRFFGALFVNCIKMASISDEELQRRKEKLKEIDDFLIDVDNKVKYILQKFNWDYEKLCEEKINMVTCSVNSQHRVPKSSIKEHEERCKWLRDGYLEDDQPFPEYSNNGSCIVITPELQTEIIGTAASKTENFQLGNVNIERPIPQTATKLQQEFTRDERLAIYDYVVANTQKYESFTDFTLLSAEEKLEKKKQMSDWEIAAAERDAKRRRASYRNKVHTNKKTHTEILREVIESQMECLQESKTQESEKEIPTAKTSKKHDDLSYYKNSKKYDNGHKESHHHKKGHHESRRERHRSRSREHTRHKKSHKKDRSSSRSKHKKHKRSVSRSRSREKYRKSSSKTT